MTTRTKTTIMIIVAAPLSTELWKFWEGSEKVINPWLALDYPLNVQWVMKFAGIEVRNLLLSWALFRLSRLNEPLRLAASVILILAVFDLGAFVWNFNKNDYSLVYLGISVLTLLYAFYHNDVALWGNRLYYRTRRKWIRWSLKLDQWKSKRKLKKSVPVKTTILKQEENLFV